MFHVWVFVCIFVSLLVVDPGLPTFLIRRVIDLFRRY